jgi:hypothetical protein
MMCLAERMLIVTAVVICASVTAAAALAEMFGTIGVSIPISAIAIAATGVNIIYWFRKYNLANA